MESLLTIPRLPPQKGGRLLGQGAYGCIFTPPLQCRPGRGKSTGRKGKLGKLTQVADIKNEIAVAKAFQAKPEAKKYLVLPEIPTLCIPVTADKQKEGELDECEAFQKYGMKKMLHYEVEYGGKTLYDRLQEISIAREFPFWEFVGNLLEVSAYLTLHGWVHNDFHSNNILVNAKFVPRLIDFGRSYSQNGITEDVVDELAAKYMPELGQITPESSAQDGIEEGVSLETILSDLRTKKPAVLNAEKILGVSREAQIAEFKKFWTSSRAVQARDWVTFWKHYWPVVDSWSIGHILLGLLGKLKMSRQFFETPEWKQRGPLLKDVLRGLVRMSPRERLDSVEALAMYDPMNAVVSGVSGRAWLERRAAQRKKM